MVKLYQHRGKPDPKLAREKQIEARRIANSKKLASKERQQQILDKVNEIRKQQQKQQQIDQAIKSQQKIETEVKQQIDIAQKQFAKDNTLYKKSMNKFESSAPTENSKTVIKETIKKLDKLNKKPSQTISAESKLTPEERKRRKQKELDAINNEYNDIEKQELRKLKTNEERKWFKDNFKNIKSIGLDASNNIMDLFGYKTILDDVIDVTKFLIGKK